MATVHYERVLLSLLDQSRVDELGHQVGSSLTVGLTLLHLLDSSGEGIKLSQLFLDSNGLFSSGLLVSCNLLLGSAALGSGLQHVGRDALGHYERGQGQ